MLGASSTSYSNIVSDSPGWDNDLYKKTSVDNKKRGSIISKGTLVICPVSLVGQWIEEAKSKLKNPGLIYPYHGGNRKRDPQLLSGNSIVVTTYDVIASDAFHHSKKGGKDYCPPLEQIRWWRIICDEGHSLRESNTKRSKAVLSLVADHKWIVSGKCNIQFLILKSIEVFFSFEIISYLVFSFHFRRHPHQHRF
jgi:SNF2 family DNA or RNA helicase